MNPSSSGWIDKFGYLANKHEGQFRSMEPLYEVLRELGFVYGMNMGIPRFIKPTHKLTHDENAKINLLFGLYYTYEMKTREMGFKYFVESVFKFYKNLGVGHISYLQKILVGKETSTQLEKLLDSRIYLEANVLSKTFNSIITNSLLLVDVLTFQKYMEGEPDLNAYAQNLEFIVINITYEALNSKTKNRSDDKLRETFRSSLTFLEEEEETVDISYWNRLSEARGTLAARYFLDIACLTVWEDQSLDYQESEFVFKLGRELGFDDAPIRKALTDVTGFFSNYAEDIPLLKEHNLAGQFYDSMSKVVDKLILRNSKRLQKELSQSKELMMLLSKSTIRELSEEEKRKVQDQLLDIFKSIPSLAIFLLPGGAVLLPIFIKLIPRLLPSSFDENRIDDSEE